MLSLILCYAPLSVECLGPTTPQYSSKIDSSDNVYCKQLEWSHGWTTLTMPLMQRFELVCPLWSAVSQAICYQCFKFRAYCVLIYIACQIVKPKSLRTGYFLCVGDLLTRFPFYGVILNISVYFFIFYQYFFAVWKVNNICDARDQNPPLVAS